MAALAGPVNILAQGPVKAYSAVRGLVFHRLADIPVKSKEGEERGNLQTRYIIEANPFRGFPQCGKNSDVIIALQLINKRSQVIFWLRREVKNVFL